MATYNQMQVQQKPKFSVAITTKGYQSLISNTLRDPARARRFTASITSAVAVNPALQISIHALREEGDSKNRDKISIFKQIIQHSARI